MKLRAARDSNQWCCPAVWRPCPLCGSGQQVVISKHMQHQLDLPTVVCADCSFVFTNPMPPREVYERFYVDKYAEMYGYTTGGIGPANSDRCPEGLKRKLEAIERIQPLSGKRLLEIGPGRGAFLYWASKLGSSVLGVEPCAEFRRSIRGTGLECVEGGLETLKACEPFDIVVMLHVLEHFYDPNEALERAREMLREDGILVVEVPNILKPFRSLDRYFLRYVHPSSFSPETLRAFLAKHGFSVVYEDAAGDDWRSPQNLLMAARRTSGCPGIPGEIGPSRRVRQEIENYRRRWLLSIMPKWYLRSVFLQARRTVFRVARRIKYLASATVKV